MMMMQQTEPSSDQELCYLGVRLKLSTYRRWQTIIVLSFTILGAALWAYDRLAAPSSWLGHNAWWILLLAAAAEGIEALIILAHHRRKSQPDD